MQSPRLPSLRCRPCSRARSSRWAEPRGTQRASALDEPGGVGRGDLAPPQLEAQRGPQRTGTVPVTAVLVVPASNHVHVKQPAASTGERIAGQGVQWTPEPVLDRDGESM